MITITSDKDRTQLKEHALELINRADFEGLIILIEVLDERNFPIPYINSFLAHAAKNGHLKIVKHLVANGADIHEDF